MFSYSFVLIFLIILGVQGNNPNGYPFGQLRSLTPSQNEQLVLSSSRSELPTLNQDLVSSRCTRVRPNIKMPDPTDNTKYYQCRNEFQYETFTCPNGGIFVDERKACIDLCEQKKPCLNDGQCIILSNLTLGCVCRRDWTGERCEIPLSSCVNNPCGPNAECRMLKSIDYTQDYVCICNNRQSYGRNCQRTVPNPCLTSSKQFHPFAFSRRAYINCDGETIFFQPCNSVLYWNQEEKRCDRTLPDILKSSFLLKQQNDISMGSRSPNGEENTVATVPVRNQFQSNFIMNAAKPVQWQNQQPVTNQFGQNQQWSQNNQQRLIPTSISNSNFDQSQKIQGDQQNLPTQISREQKLGLGVFQWQNLVPDFKAKTNQPIVSQSKPWQGSQSVPNNQQWLQGQNQQVLNKDFAELPLEKRQEGQGIQSVDLKTQNNNQDFVKQSKQWAGTFTILQQQPNDLTSQSWSQNQNQQSLPTETISQAQKPIQQDTQFKFNQQLQNQLISSPLETTTIGNTDVQQGLFVYNLRGWKQNRN